MTMPNDKIQNKAKSQAIPLTEEQQAQQARLAQLRDMPVMQTPPIQPASADNNSSHGFYSRLLAQINPPETEEEKARRARREKREKTLARLSDGLSMFSALSNLYYTSKGAPNMYVPSKQSETERADNRWDKLHELYRQHTREYADAAAKAHALDEALAERRRAAGRQAERDKATDDYRAKMLNLRAAANAANAARRANEDAFNREKFDEQKRHNHAMEIKRASSSRSSGGSKKYYGTFNGRAYATKADYDKAVRTEAAAAGVNTEERRDEIINSKGQPISGTGRTVGRNTAAVAADVEKLNRQRAEAARRAKVEAAKKQAPAKKSTLNKNKLKNFTL